MKKICLLILTFCLLSNTSFQAQNLKNNVFFVAPGGKDSYPGTKKKPLATIQTAVNLLLPGDSLLILDGVYRETVTFPRSGTREKPITILATRGARVLVSGCDPLETGWTRYKNNIWKVPMPWTLGLGRNQVFCDGRIMIEARYPNKPDPGLEMYVADLSPLWPTFGEFSISDPVNKPGRVVSKLLDGDPPDHWKGAIYYGIHFEGWSSQSGVIESSESGAINVGERTGQWWFASKENYWQKHEEGRGMIVDHMNALDQPGEWHYLDGFLYFIPPSGTTPKKVDVKRRQIAFDLSGREYIRIAGINVQGASARLDNSAYCVFDRCNFDYISHFTRFFNMDEVERGQNTIKTGETGIFCSGHDNSFLNCSIRHSAGAGIFIRGYHHTIHNCLIDEVCYTSHYFKAITDARSDYPEYSYFRVGGHVITYNTLSNSGRHFFGMFGEGNTKSSRDRGPIDNMATLFAHNHLYNGMLETRDAGFVTGYYCSGGTLNGLRTRIDYNVMHDNYDLFGMRLTALGMVYLDAGTSDVEVNNNLFWASPGSLQIPLWFNTCCVNVSEKDNVFHPQFTRTSATLNPADFPGQKPFRFGHDFTNPPPLAKWPPLKDLQLDINLSASHSGNLQQLKDGDWFGLGRVNFDENWQSALLKFTSDVMEINTSDRAARSGKRHIKVTDPLVMEAIVNEGSQDQIKTQWTFIRNVNDGSWVKFSQMPLGEGYRRFRVVYGNDSAEPRWMEVRLDSLSGPLIGSISLPRTDIPRVYGSPDNPTPYYIQIYSQAICEIPESATGTRDVFLVFHAKDGKTVGEFEYFRFEQYRGEIPLQKNEVKLELRAGSKDGVKLGEFYPHFTGGIRNFRDFVAKLEPVHGTQELFLVVRSSVSGPIGSLESLGLEKSDAVSELNGIGDPPLMKGGKMVLPQPTHLPRSRPGDKYIGKKPW